METLPAVFLTSLAALFSALLLLASNARPRAVHSRLRDARPRVAVRRREGRALRVLVPVLHAPSAKQALGHICRERVRGERVEVHLLHVRSPLSRYVPRWSANRDEKILRPARKLLDAFHVPYLTHLECGQKREVIVAMAERLRVDRIVLAAARDNSLTRFVDDALIEKVTASASVPVDVVGYKSVSRLERVGVPMGLSVALGLLCARFSD